MERERSTRGISLQEIRPEIQMGLIENSQRLQETTERQILFR